MSLFAALIIGGFTSVGCTTIVGFLNAFEPESISGFSSGTGLTAISGSPLYLLFSSIGLTFNIIVLLLIPAALLYLFVFKVNLDLKARLDVSVKARVLGTKFTAEEVQAAGEMKEEGEQAEAEINEPMTFQNAMNVMRVVGPAL
jgi:CLN3 protein